MFIKSFLIALISIFISVMPANAELSSKAQELKLLYEEFRAFKDDAEFIEVGYGGCCKYQDWADRVLSLDESSFLELYTELGVAPSELWQLGKEYYRGRGNGEQAKQLETAFSLALNDYQMVDGEGKVSIGDDLGCYMLDTFSDIFQHQMNSNFEIAEEIMRGPDCKFIVQNTIVQGPLDRQEITLAEGLSPEGYVLVKIPDTNDIWMSADSVTFFGEE